MKTVIALILGTYLMNKSLLAGFPPPRTFERSGNVERLNETKIGEHGFEKQKMEGAPEKSTFYQYGFEKYPDPKQRIQLKKKQL